LAEPKREERKVTRKRKKKEYDKFLRKKGTYLF